MRRRATRTLTGLAAGMLVLAACTGDPQASPTAEATPTPVLEPSEPFAVAVVTLTGPDGEAVTVPVYVADDPSKRARGLMEREHLDPGAGMVFLFEAERTGGFWMKNTLIPLSIAFYDADGTVLVTLDMEPCREDPCPVYDPGVAYRGALEVNQGFFDEIGLDPGWRVSLPTSVEIGGRSAIKAGMATVGTPH